MIEQQHIMSLSQGAFPPNAAVPPSEYAKTSHASEVASEKAPAHGDKAWTYAKSRFDKENWLGSAVMLSQLYRAYNNITAALVRQVNGQRQPDRIRVMNFSFFTLGYLWSFFSKRGGEFPEGKTAPQRIVHTIQHPNRSSAQFEYLGFLPFNMLASYNNIKKGLMAYGVGLKAGEAAYSPEKIRLFIGMQGILSEVLSGYGHFRSHTASSLQRNESPVKPGLVGAVKEIWRHDKVLFAGELIANLSSILGVIEGWRKMGSSRKEAGHLIQSAVITLISTAAYSIYTFQRIAKSNFGAKEDIPTIDQKVTNSSNEEIEPIQDQRNSSNFLQKLINQKQETQRLAHAQSIRSFAEQVANTQSSANLTVG